MPASLSGSSQDPLPFISVLVPIRDEADFIERCLQSICGQDYPADRYEIVVMDGMSTDGTRDIVRRMADEDPRIRLLDNPGKAVATAMNLGIAAGRGELFTRIDGHALVASDFLRQSVEVLRAHPEAWVVGGPIETVAENLVGQAISASMACPIGVGNSHFRIGGKEGWVDTLAFGTHQRWIIDRVGWFDEELVRNQDDDFNQRIRQVGGKIWLSARIKSTYFSRTSLSKLWRQYFQYGFWRIRTLQKHGRAGAVRQLIPMAFVAGVLALAAGSLIWAPLAYLLAGVALAYSLVLVAGALLVGRASGWRCGVLAPLVFAILHGAYGLGSLWGVVHFVLLRGRALGTQARHRMSR